MPDLILPHDFYSAHPIRVACGLLGQRLVTRINGARTSGLIVETEAYLADGDSASHSARGLGKSNAAMFGPAGRAYVYPIHAKFCFNVVTETKNVGSAVLIRALQPDFGLETMAFRRGAERSRLLTTGPGRLCQALGIDRSLDHVDLTTRRKIWIERANWAALPLDHFDLVTGFDRNANFEKEMVINYDVPHESEFERKSKFIFVTPRIGVTSASRRLLRFAIGDNPYASGPKRLRSPMVRSPII